MHGRRPRRALGPVGRPAARAATATSRSAELPPPTQGVTVLEVVPDPRRIRSPAPARRRRTPAPPLEAMKLAAAPTATTHVTDPDAMRVLAADLLDDDWIAARRAAIDPERADHAAGAAVPARAAPRTCASPTPTGCSSASSSRTSSSLGSGVHVPRVGHQPQQPRFLVHARRRPRERAGAVEAADAHAHPRDGAARRPARSSSSARWAPTRRRRCTCRCSRGSSTTVPTPRPRSTPPGGGSSRRTGRCGSSAASTATGSTRMSARGHEIIETRLRGRARVGPRPRDRARPRVATRWPPIRGRGRSAGLLTSTITLVAMLETVDDVQRRARRARLPGRRGPRHRRSSSRSTLQRPLLLEGEAGVGKTEVAKVLAALDRRRARPPPVLRGHRRRPGRLRVGLLPPAAAPAGGRGERRRGRRGRALLRAVPRAPAAAARHRPPRRRRRRCCSSTRSTAPTTSSRRSCSRSSPTTRSRSPSSGTFRAEVAAGRGAHVEPHPRRARRAQASLPLPLDRASRLRARARDRARSGRPRCPRRSPAQVAAAVEALRELELYKPPGVAETIDWAQRARRARAHARSTSTRSTSTLGTILKYREDQERVRGAARRRAAACERVPDRAQCLTRRSTARRPRRSRPPRGRVRAGAARRGARRARRHAPSTSPRRSARSGSPTARRCTGPAGPRSCAGPRTSTPTTAPSRAFWRPDALRRSRTVPVAAAESSLALRPRRRRRRRRRAERRRRRRRRAGRCRCGAARPRCCATATSRTTRPAEFAEARRLMADLRLAGALRRSAPARAGRARRAAAPTCGARCAARCAPAASRSAARSLEPSTRPRRLVLLCDVSGSMEPYARALVRFLHAAVVGRGRVEAFALGTRLTRITRELSSPRSRRRARRRGAAGRRLVGRHPARRGPARVQRRVGRARHGPRRGGRDPLRRLGPGRPRRARRADGAAAPGRAPDRVGEPAQGVARATRRSPRGMAAALPYVDEFVEGHSLASLEDARRR